MLKETVIISVSRPHGEIIGKILQFGLKYFSARVAGFVRQ